MIEKTSVTLGCVVALSISRLPMREADAENRFGLTSCSPIFPPFFQFFRSMTLAEPKSYSLRRAWDPTAPLEELKKLLEEDWEVPLESVGIFFSLPDFYLGWYFGGPKIRLGLEGRGRGSLEDEKFFHLEIIEDFWSWGKVSPKKSQGGNVFVSKEETDPHAEDLKIWQGVCAYLEDPERAEMEETESDDADADEAVPEAEGPPPWGGWYPPPSNSATNLGGGCFELGVALKKRRRKTTTAVTLYFFLPFFCLCDLDLATLYCTFPAASNLVWWNM